MADNALKHIEDPKQVGWLYEHYMASIAQDGNLKERLLNGLVSQIEKGNTAYVGHLKNFVLRDPSLVELLAFDFQANNQASKVVRMKLARFLSSTPEARTMTMELLNLLARNPALSNTTLYVNDMSGPKYMSQDPMYPTIDTMYLPPGGSNPYGIPPAPQPAYPMNPYGMPPSVPGMVPLAVPVAPAMAPAGAPVVPPAVPGDRCLIYMDHKPGNNTKFVEKVKATSVQVYVFTTYEQFKKFVDMNYQMLITYAMNNKLRIMTDRLFACDFDEKNIGTSVVNALISLGFNCVPSLVYCWQVDLVKPLESLGVIVTKEARVAFDFAAFKH